MKKSNSRLIKMAASTNSIKVNNIFFTAMPGQIEFKNLMLKYMHIYKGNTPQTLPSHAGSI